MIPLWGTVTQYTADVLGQAVKVVACENCSTEYVYLMERVSTGSAYTGGISLLPAPDDEAQSRASSMAREGLKDLLKEEYDPVPCPACGHYQKHMFPKLQSPPSDSHSLLYLAAILIGLGAAVATVWYLLRLFRAPDNSGLTEAILLGSIALAMVAVLTRLSILDKRRTERFDPNTEADREARIALGKARAVTRAQFDALRGEVPSTNEQSNDSKQQANDT